MTEDDLAELLGFVRAKGKFGLCGPGITTHPQAVDDSNQQELHRALLILEERGDVVRHHVHPAGSVTWMPSVKT